MKWIKLIKNRKAFLFVGIIITIFIGSIIFIVRAGSKIILPLQSTVFPSKKTLAERIKKDLQENLAIIRNSSGNICANIKYSCSSPFIISNFECVWVNGKQEERKISSSELEKEDWDEIINLIKQVKQLWEQKREEWKRKVESQLNEEQKKKKFSLFSRSITLGPHSFARFCKWEEKTWILVPIDNPSLQGVELKVGSFYLVETENENYYKSGTKNQLNSSEKIKITLL